MRQCRHTAVSGAMPWLRWPTAEYRADQSVLTYTHCGTAYTVDPPDYLDRPAAGSSWPCGSSPPAAAAPPPTPARLSVGLSIGAPPSHSSARSVDRVRAVDTHSESSACPRLLGWYGSAWLSVTVRGGVTFMLGTSSSVSPACFARRASIVTTSSTIRDCATSHCTYT